MFKVLYEILQRMQLKNYVSLFMPFIWIRPVCFSDFEDLQRKTGFHFFQQITREHTFAPPFPLFNNTGNS